jgi:hypothetical protein
VVAIVAHFAGSIHDYHQGHGFAAWLVAVRPSRCSHCGKEHTCILWGSYLRWVYTTTERLRIRIERVRCTICGVTDALLPCFLHIFRRYALPLIQRALFLALERGLWGRALIDAVGPYHQPAPATLREWVWSFALSAERWLVLWLQHRLLVVETHASLDFGRPPAYLQAVPSPRRRAAFAQGWQALRLAEALYAAIRARKPALIFQAQALFAFLAASLEATGRPPRVLWPAAPARPP